MSDEEQTYEMAAPSTETGGLQESAISLQLMFTIMTCIALAIAPLSVIESWRTASAKTIGITAILGACVGLILGITCAILQGRGSGHTLMMAILGTAVGLLAGVLTLAPLYDNPLSLQTYFLGAALLLGVVLVVNRLKPGPASVGSAN